MHLNGRTPECVNMWIFKLLRFWNSFWHLGQLTTAEFRLCTSLECRCKAAREPSNFEQSLHWKSRRTSAMSKMLIKLILNHFFMMWRCYHCAFVWCELSVSVADRISSHRNHIVALPAEDWRYSHRYDAFLGSWVLRKTFYRIGIDMLLFRHAFVRHVSLYCLFQVQMPHISTKWNLW